MAEGVVGKELCGGERSVRVVVGGGGGGWLLAGVQLPAAWQAAAAAARLEVALVVAALPAGPAGALPEPYCRTAEDGLASSWAGRLPTAMPRSSSQLQWFSLSLGSGRGS